MKVLKWKGRTCELIVDSLNLSLQSVSFAEWLDEELGEPVERSMQVSRADLKMVICIFLYMYSLSDRGC